MRTYIGLHWVITRKKVIRHNRVLNVKFDTDWKISWIVKFEMGVVGRGKSNADWCNAALSKNLFFCLFIDLCVLLWSTHKTQQLKICNCHKRQYEIGIIHKSIGTHKFLPTLTLFIFRFPSYCSPSSHSHGCSSAKTLT